MSSELSFHSRLQTAAVSTQLSEQASGKQRGSLVPGLPGRLLLTCLGQPSASVHLWDLLGAEFSLTQTSPPGRPAGWQWEPGFPFL